MKNRKCSQIVFFHNYGTFNVYYGHVAPGRDSSLPTYKKMSPRVTTVAPESQEVVHDSPFKPPAPKFTLTRSSLTNRDAADSVIQRSLGVTSDGGMRNLFQLANGDEDESELQSDQSQLRAMNDIGNVLGSYSNGLRIIKPLINDRPTQISVRVCSSSEILPLSVNVGNEQNCAMGYLQSDLEVQRDKFNSMSAYGSKTNRSKRGILNFVGSIDKFLWGTATTSDIDELAKALENDLSQVVNKQNEIIAGYEIDAKSTKSSLAVMVKTLTNLKQMHSELSKSLNALKKGVQGNTDQIQVLNEITYISTMLSYASQLVQFVNARLIDLTNYYRSIRDSIDVGELSLDVMSRQAVAEIQDLVIHDLPPNLEIIPTWINKRTIDSSTSSLAVHDQSLLLSLQIPLQTKSNDYQTWGIKSVPIAIHQGSTTTNPIVFQFDASNDVFILDMQNRRWTSFTHETFVHCVSRKDRVCPESQVWNNDIDSSCLPSLVTNKNMDLAASTCHLKRVTFEDVPPLSYVPISNNQWLISVIGKSADLYEKCSTEGKKGIASAGATSIQGVKILEIKEGCHAELLGHLFTPTIQR